MLFFHKDIEMYNSTKDISNRILLIMNQLQLNQNQLAKKLNVTQPAVSKYLQGRIPPPFVLLELAKLSGMTIEWILSGDESIHSGNTFIAEEKASYTTGDSIEAKLKRLPIQARNSVEVLIDFILKVEKK